MEAHVKRYGKRPPEARQLTYDIAVQDEYTPWLEWLDDQLALLPDRIGEALARKMWLDENFWPVNFELAAGAGLREAGLRVAYEQPWEGLSPDWTVLSDSGKPLAFVEVHTDMPTAQTYGRMRVWHGLVERIKAIPVPVLLQLASTKPISPPDARTAKKIAQDLKRELLSGRSANAVSRRSPGRRSSRSRARSAAKVARDARWIIGLTRIARTHDVHAPFRLWVFCGEPALEGRTCGNSGGRPRARD